MDIKNVIENLKNDLKKEKAKVLVKSYVLDELLLERVLYELDILDILKKYLYFSQKSGCIRMKDIHKRQSNFHWETLKEWLEKDGKSKDN